jgi:hypothetical protein
MQRALGIAVCVAATLATLWPAFGNPHDDSFPLSTYPMFTERRGKPTLYQVVASDGSGTLTRVAPRYLGSSEVLQAKALLDSAARGGARKRRAFCEAVAQRVREHGQLHHWQELSLVRLRFDPIAYFTTGPQPLEREVLERCRVAAAPGQAP